MYYEIKLFTKFTCFYNYNSIGIPVLCIKNDAHTKKIKTLKGCFNTFQTVHKDFSF